MATRKQRAANRRNAQLSTGPVTPEGKAAVRLNALKHGLTAENATIFDEDEQAFNELRDTFLDQFHPDGPLETALVHQIVNPVAPRPPPRHRNRPLRTSPRRLRGRTRRRRVRQS
jgi:hypothetical protein